MDHDTVRDSGDGSRTASSASHPAVCAVGNRALESRVAAIQREREAYCRANGITEKKCTRCGLVQPLTAFHKMWTMKLGRTSRCRSCLADADAKRWLARREAHNEWAKRRPSRYAKRASNAAYAERHPLARSARSLLSSAFRHGKLAKPSQCEAATLGGCCGIIHAHHEDYTQPYAFVGLCRRHHNDVHNKGAITVGGRTIVAPTEVDVRRQQRALAREQSQ